MTSLPRLLLDTHFCLYLIRHQPQEAPGFFDAYAPGEVAISSLTLAALRASAQRSSNPEQNRRALDQFILPLVVVDFDAEAAAWLGRLTVLAEQNGHRAGNAEMLAAQALSHDAVLATSRPHLYTYIPNLQIHSVTPPGDSISTRSAGAPALAHVSEHHTTPFVENGQIHVAGSHDFTLDLVAHWLHALCPERSMTQTNVGSLSGLLALQQRIAHLAGSHLLDQETGDFNKGYIEHLLAPLGLHVILFGFVERTQGLIVQKGNPKHIGTLDDLKRDDVVFVNRQRGAGTRILLDHHLAARRIDVRQIRGYEHPVATHLEVATAVAGGKADSGLGVLAAARTLDLDFVPLFDERYDLVIPVEHATGALLAPLLELLRHPPVEFIQQVAALGGYRTGVMGKVLAEI